VKKGFKITRTSISILDIRLKLFAKGRKDWCEELFVAQRSDQGEGSSSWQVSGEVLPPASSEYWRQECQSAPSGQVPMEEMGFAQYATNQAWGSSMPPQAPPPYAYPPPPYQIHEEHPYGAQYAHLLYPERGIRTAGAFADQTFEYIDETKRRMDTMGESAARMIFQFGAMRVMTPEEYQGGPSQEYYEQGYNSRQPPNDE